MISKKKGFYMNIIPYLLLILFAFICAFSFYWMILSALKPDSEVRSVSSPLITRTPTLKNFTKVLYTAGFLKYIKNSLLASIVTCFVSVMTAVMAGYTLSRYYKEQMIKISNFAMLVSRVIPGMLLLVPLYIIMRNFGLSEPYISLILSYTTFVIPLYTFMMSSFFDIMPITLEETAEIDGTSKFQMMVKAMLPIFIPSLVLTGPYVFIRAWSEFMFSYIFISTDQYRTPTPVIILFKGSNIIDWGGLMAASVAAALLVVCLFFFIQRYFLSGPMSGLVKG